VGQDIREYLNLDDASIEVDLTPNRGDCLSLAGLAREVGALYAPVTRPVVPAVPGARRSALGRSAAPRPPARVTWGVSSVTSTCPSRPAVDG
jgi:phenylalanyl-tRNA synthetase beta subunit